ncbi:hypothetical protein [Lacipirellula parvula]|uniref:Uncharacterized protein n=1 Tax=Lacipirellula parvula TaxID=2650471 RepID=A0A5K7X5X9_9BACT|nr:hypothetical protein [Lacipirellula parvula]BBO32154.1 hypothetical protein PLANPX_1766 [Lacipirellula parvula]
MIADTPPQTSRPPSLALSIIGSVLAVLLVVAGALYWAAQAVDPFYAAATQAKPAELKEAGEQLENRVADLTDQAETTGRWESVFSDEEVNGWLATVLREKYPTLLPPEVVDPRVSFVNGKCLLGYRYQGDKVRAMVTIEGEAFMASDDVAGLRLRKARLGFLPLPLSKVVDHINDGAKQLKIPVKWVEQEGDPVMLVGVTNALSTDEEVRRLDAIDLRDGQLVLAGSIEPRPTLAPAKSSSIGDRARAAVNAAASAAAAAAVQ